MFICICIGRRKQKTNCSDFGFHCNSCAKPYPCGISSCCVCDWPMARRRTARDATASGGRGASNKAKGRSYHIGEVDVGNAVAFAARFYDGILHSHELWS